MAGGEDRLSELPDDLLRRILHFAPLKEAASTTALSRRWRAPLWLSSGAVNLETRVTYDRYVGNRLGVEAGFSSRHTAFVAAAVAALDAAAAADDDHVTRLTLRLEADSHDWISRFVNRYVEEDRNLVDAVLSHRAARRVEELRLQMVAEGWSSDDDYNGETFKNRVGLYTVTLDALPWETLRVLELTNCNGLCQREAHTVVLPQLWSLRLHHCAQHLGSLQRVIDAAPALAVLRLESVIIDATEDEPSQNKHGRAYRYMQDDRYNSYSNGYGQGYNLEDPAYGYNLEDPAYGYNLEDHVDGEEEDNDEDDASRLALKEAAPRGLRCPAATVLVLDSCRWECRWEETDHAGDDPYGYGYGYNNEKRDAVLIDMVIHAPRLRRFKYKGLLRPISFSPPPPELEQVDLQFSRDDYNRDRDRDNDRKSDLATFWQFARSFTSTKEMRLRVDHLEDIAVLSDARQTELLPTFRRLRRVELQGAHRTRGKTAGAAIGNLLRCCPVLSALRINLTAQHHTVSKDYRWAEEFLERKFRSDFDKSIDHLDRCCSESTTISKEGDYYEDGAKYDQVCEIPTLSQCHLFECLQNSLTRVGLQFRLEGSNCLGVKLIKFFAQKAMVLQEMHIDGGNRKLDEHVNPEIQRWLSSSSQRENSGATSFVLLPLKR